MRILFALIGLVLASCGTGATELDLGKLKTSVDLLQYQPNTIVVSTRERRLFFRAQDGSMFWFPVGVGRDSLQWSGTATVSRMEKWPSWTATAEGLKRNPKSPRRVEGGAEDNPLGARALYLYKGKQDTLYRIHGTNQPESVGGTGSAGCIRMINDHVIFLYTKVVIGTKVVVLK